MRNVGLEAITAMALGICGYNLATGNPTMFNEDSRVKAEFAEMKTANILFNSIPGYEKVINRDTPLDKVDCKER